MNRFFIILLIIISLTCCKRGKQEIKINEANPDVIQADAKESFSRQTESLDDVLNSIININSEKSEQLITFINGFLEDNVISSYDEEIYGHLGPDYSYNSNGKYLFITEMTYGGKYSSFENETLFIIDTELIKLIPDESIFINADAPNPSFHKLVIEYLSKEDRFDRIIQEDMPKAEDPIINYGFTLFYAQNGIGLRWHKGYMAANAIGPIKIVLPYSKVQIYLTQTGKEIFK